MEGIIEAKRILRSEVLERREAIDDATREAMSAAILDRVRGLEPLREAGVVLAYAGFGSELRTDEFLRAVLAEDKTLVLPRVEERDLVLYAVGDLQRELIPGTWGIREPDPEACQRVDPRSVDFVLAPGVAFDARGGRLGYGAGFYDRLLSKMGGAPALVCGAFEVQMVEVVPRDESDVLVDLVITEERTYEAGPERG